MKKSEKLYITGILVLFLFCFGHLSNATIYYISSSGNDANSGTSQGESWRSLEKINSYNFNPGDQILFNRGDTWRGTLIVNASGTAGNPIIYGAYGSGTNPKIYGSEMITGWTRHSGNIYKASFSKDINQLFIDDSRIRIARHPNSGYLYIGSVRSSTEFSCNALDGGINYAGASWFGRTGVYHTPTQIVTSSSSTTLRLDAIPAKDLGTGEGFILMNKLEFLDQPGEWYYDASSGTVYLWTPGGDSPANYSITGSVYENGIYADSRDYITIQNLEILHQSQRSIEVRKCDYLTIDNNYISYPDEYGIYDISNSSHNTIKNNVITGANHYGVYVMMSYSDLADNKILDCGLFDNLGKSGVGRYNLGGAVFIAGGEGNNLIRYNRIINAGYNGIYFARSNNRIEYNFINYTCLLKGDGGGIYTSYATDPGPHGSVVRNNIVLNVTGNRVGTSGSRAFGEGIYIDEIAEDVTVDNNTIAYCSDAGIYLHDNAGAEVKNNTVMDGRYGILINLDHGSNTVHNNIFYALYEDDYEPNQLLVKRNSENTSLNYNTYINHYASSKIFKDDGSYYDFSGWKSATGNDANSTIDLSPLETGETEELFYNDTKTSKTISLGTTIYKDIYGKQISGSITLEPFTSIILIKTLDDTGSNNQSPVIYDQYFNIIEPKMPNDLIGQVIASDPDDGQILTYSIIGGNESGMFAINSSNGEIYANTDISLIPDQSIVLDVEVTDNADNPLSSSAYVTINISGLDDGRTTDITAPVISSFDIPSTSTSLTVSVLSWGCSDDKSVTGYKLTETSTVPLAVDDGWESSKASSYTFSEAGNKVLYAWAKDAAGNVSIPVYDSVTITLSESNDTVYLDSVEYITICEGDNYMGWTEPGVYEHTVTTDTTLQTAGTNMIINGDFSSGIDGWNYWGATGYSLSLNANSQEYISSPASLQVECISTGTSIGSLQLIKKGELTIEAGREYELVFFAKATEEFAIGALYMHKATSPYTNYGTFEVSRPVISTTWGEHRIKFTATHSASDASFRIYLGNSLPAGQSLYLDDISLSEYSGNETVTINQTITTYLTVNSTQYTTENVTIEQGEEYMGWTEPGTYQRTLASSTGCDSIVTTILAVDKISDTTAPVISSFDIPSTSTSLTVSVLSWGCSDDQSVTGYKLTETSTVPLAVDDGWESSKASSYTFSEAGNKVLYAWAKDAAGNVSSPVYDSVTITLSESNDTVFVDSVEYVTICEGDNYMGWTEPGVYVDTVYTDSVIQITTTYLTVNPTQYTTERINIKKGEEYMGWTESGTYQRTLVSSTGCDSIVTTELKVTQGNGRNKSADPFITDDAYSMIPDSIFDTRGNGDLILYPNPARTFINIAYNTLPDLNTKIEIIDIHGRVMLTREIQSSLTRITIDRLTSGIYYLRWIQGQKQMIVRKFIKQ